MTRKASKKINVLGAGTITAVFLLVSSTLVADNVNVNCGSGGTGLQAAIDNLSSPTGPHTINVTGTCVENIIIDRIENLTIDGGGTAVIRLATPENETVIAVNGSQGILFRGLTVDGDNQDFAIGIYATASRVTIVGCTILNATDLALFADQDSTMIVGGRNPGQEVVIHDNAFGAGASQSSLQIRGRTTIENNAADALFVFNDSRLNISGPPGADNVFRNNGFGIGIFGSLSGLSGSNLIENNGPYGVLCARSNVAFNATFENAVSGFTTIQGHTVNGIVDVSSNVTFNPGPNLATLHRVLNNGSGPITFDAGIYASRPGSLLVRFVEIANNAGSGVLIEAGAYANFQSAQVTGNTGGGILALGNATVKFGDFDQNTGDPIPANTTISGNGGKAIACDKTAVVYGDTAALPKFKCKGKPTIGSAAAAEIDLQQRIDKHLQRLSRE